VEEEIIRRHGSWNAAEEVFGDAYGSTRSIAEGQSAYDVLEKYGVDVCPIAIKNDLQAISHLQLWMRHVAISAHLEHQRNGPQQTTPTFGEVVTQWRYRKRQEGSPSLILKPVHDEYCHGGDCLKIWAQTVDLPEPSQQPIQTGKVRRAQPSALSVPQKYRPRR
jgi:hypothetical protein